MAYWSTLEYEYMTATIEDGPSWVSVAAGAMLKWKGTAGFGYGATSPCALSLPSTAARESRKLYPVEKAA